MLKKGENMRDDNECNINELEDSEESFSYWSKLKDFCIKTLQQDENIKFYHAKGSKSAYIVKDGKTLGHLNLSTSDIPAIPYELRADIGE